ncbi:uncharacterized protein LOC131722727 [Acipenser ruthenus]|uniref:uncharacterized protein LOC131722727 n=1 Tax=Acipenser ruthenus TaxID=7906 RepID=UPI002740CAAB|nr:uncharacterized protein LOC131722727 [Acipenser ruthenus]
MELFSTPTLTVLPGASVWEGEAVTLQCGAHINKQGTQLQYRYMKDKRYLSGAGSQDRHSIPSAELSNSGNYLCDVEAVELGKNKQSDSVSLTVKESWSWIIAALSVSLVLIIFFPVTLLLFYRYKTKGFLFIAAKSRRPADQTPAQPSRGTELSGLGQEPGNSTASNLESEYAEVKPNQQNKAKPRPKRDCDVLYSAVLVKKPEDNPSAADNSDVLYSELDMRNVNKKKKGKTLADNKPEVLYSEINQAKPSGKPTADNAESMYATVLPKKKRK